MRTAFIDQLIQEARQHQDVFLVVGDLGYSVVEPFAEAFPDRFLNVGIAEQNMIGVAAGLAMEGYNVYVYSIGNFPTLRCMEQIRYDVAYHDLSVKVVAVGGGYAYGSLGASHHATEELGMLRTIPNMIITAPGDPAEARALTTFSANTCKPMYIRLGKAGEPKVHTEPIESMAEGEILTIKECDTAKVALMTTGSMLDYAVKFVAEHDIDCSIYSCPFVKPINTGMLNWIGDKYSKIVVIEEHQLSGGFSSAVVEQLNDLYAAGKLSRYPVVVRRAIGDRFLSKAGSQQYIRELAGLVLLETDLIC